MRRNRRKTKRIERMKKAWRLPVASAKATSGEWDSTAAQQWRARAVPTVCGELCFSKPKLTELCCFKNSAAFSSALPPISPINMMPSVAGSFRKISRQSIKSVPLKGSPPMPEKVRVSTPGENLRMNHKNQAKKCCFNSVCLPLSPVF